MYTCMHACMHVSPHNIEVHVLTYIYIHVYNMYHYDDIWNSCAHWIVTLLSTMLV